MPNSKANINSAKVFQLLKPLVTCLAFLLLLHYPNHSSAQIQIGEHVQFGGRIGLDISYYNRFNAPSLREKYRLNFYAQPYFKIKEWDIKFNILVGSYHKKHRQEFNKFGTSIGNDKIKFHLGHHNLQISTFTLNGHTILGGGIETYPGKFRLGVSYGRFRRDIDPSDYTTTDFILPSFNRFGLAGKIGVGSKDNFLDVIVLRVTDNSSSLSSTASGSVLPQDNAVISLNTLQKLFKQKLVFEGEFAMSAYTNDNTETIEDSSDFEIAKVAGFLLKRNATTDYSKAIRTSLTYNNALRKKDDASISKMNGFNIKLIYERIDPNYRSMGTYYLRNDLQRIRITSQLRFAQNKLIISPQIGYENNDLEKSRLTQNKRILGGLQSTIRIKNSTFINLGYMNFNSTLENNSTDSLLLKKVSHNITFSFTNRHQIKAHKNMVRFNLGYQTGTNKTEEANANYLGNLSSRLSYSISIIEKVLELEPSFQINTYKRLTGGNQLRLSPSITAKVKLMEQKMTINYNFTSIIVKNESLGITNSAIRNQLRWNYRFHEKQSLSFRFAHQQNIFKSNTNYGDLQMDLRYSVNL